MATLLRIANEKYINNVSHETGFSLNGGVRNVAYVGQTSLARKTQKPFFTRYHGPAGHGGCCGTYFDSYVRKDRCCSNDPTIIKNSVLNTKGMLRRRNKWLNSTYPNTVVQPDSNFPLNASSGSRTSIIANNTISHNNIVLSNGKKCVQFTETIDINNNSTERRMQNLACNYNTSFFPGRVNNTLCFSTK